MTKHNRLAWPEPPPPLPEGLTRKVFITLPLGFTLNRDEMDARVAAGTLSHEDAQRLLQEDEHRKAINAILGYFSYWELRDWQSKLKNWPLVPSSVPHWHAPQGRLESPL